MTRFLPGLVGLCLFAANSPASPATDRVEPLSSPLRLSMTAQEVIAALGPPRSDNRAFGGGISYPGLRVLFDATGQEIGTLTLEGDTRLASGLGVGTPLARVKEEFPGGTMVYDSYDVTAGQYALSFRASGGKVDRIVIRPSGRRFTALTGTAPTAPAPALGTLAGQWIDPRNAQSFELFADGRYRTGVGGEGRVTTSPEGLVFSGVLSAWNQGRATLSADRQVIEFYWRNAEGAQNYFAFQRVAPAKAQPAPPVLPAAAAQAELRALAGRWVSQSARNDYDNGAFDRGAGEDGTPLFILENGTWRYGTQSGKVTISDASPADLAFMDFKPTAKPENLPRRKFELQGWAGDRAMGFWRTDPADGQPYRVVLHFRIREPRPGLATWIRSRAPN